MNSGTALALAGPSRVAVAGRFSGTIDLGHSILTSKGQTDLFVAGFDGHGAALWSVAGGGAGDDVADGLAADPTGGLYLTGSFQGPVTFGGRPLSTGTGSGVFLLKLPALP
jgi:hypothetical protein